MVAPIELVQQVIAEWTQQPCPPMLENGRPIITVRVRPCPFLQAARSMLADSSGSGSHTARVRVSIASLSCCWKLKNMELQAS